MSKLFILLTLTTRLYLQDCQDGCLKCTKESECEICDILLFQVLDSQTNSCKTITSPNCKLINLNGNCTICSTNYYLNSNNCVKVSTTKLEANPQCELWDRNQNCSKCTKGYQIIQSECVALDNPISNCDVQQGEICLTCDNGYRLSSDRLTCTALPSISNCHTYSQQKCETCEEGYIMNKNLYLENYQDMSNSQVQQNVFTLLENFIKTEKVESSISTCQILEVDYCKTLQDFQTCLECEDTHYLTKENKCQLNPEQTLANCITYKSKDQCSVCQQGYFLKNDACSPVQGIDNCSEYSQTASSSKCIRCQSDFYLSSSTNCVERQNGTIKDCRDYNLDHDSCEVCGTGKVGKGGTGNQFTECVDDINSCLEHDTTGTEVQCSKCEVGYFISNEDSTECTKGPSENNCKEYLQTPNVQNCYICDDQYYLSANSCIQQQDINKCEHYSQRIKDNCAECQDLYFLFKLGKICTRQWNEVSNCVEYNQQISIYPNSRCSKCEDGYYLNESENLCVNKQNEIPNCLQFQNQNACLTCEEGYGKDVFDLQCKEPFDSFVANCFEEERISQESVAKMSCKYCEEGSYPIQTVNSNVCIERSKISYFGEQSSDKTFNIPNCVAYNAEGRCSKCVSDMKLDEDYECVNSCPEGQTNAAFLTDLTLENQVFNKCLVVASLVELTGPLPVLCKQGAVTVVTTQYQQNEFYSNIDVNSSQSQGWVTELMMVTPTVSCVEFTTNSTVGDQQVSTIPSNCQYFTQNSNNFKCVKCQDIYTGSALLGHLSCTSRIDNCRSDQDILNVPVFFKKISSCERCNTNYVSLLFGFFSTSAPYNFLGFSSTNNNVNNFINNVSQTNTVQACVLDNQSSLETVINKSMSESQYISNCALFVVNMSLSQGDNNLNENGIKCAYCQPGYSPSDSELDTQFTSSCTLIANCVASNQNWANACNQCQTGYAYQMTLTRIFFNKCVNGGTNSPAPENCFAYSLEANKCALCVKGYYLNQEGYCEIITAPNCKSGSFIQAGQVLENQTFRLYTYYAKNGVFGCNECSNSNFISITQIPNFMQNYICSGSSYLNQSTLPSTNFFVENCRIYSSEAVVDQQFNVSTACKECKSGYRVNADGNKCHLLSSSPNCKIFRNDNNGCMECEDTSIYGIIFSSGSYNCFAHSDQNCELIKQENQSSVSQCETCMEGYYLQDNECVEGHVPNCKSFNSITQCSECLEGYVLINENSLKTHTDTNEQVSYCYLMPQSLQCESMSITALDQGSQMECTSCSSIQNFPIVQTGQDQLDNGCYSFNQISNCEEYDVELADIDPESGHIQRLSNSNFSCLKCSKEYKSVKSGYECIRRTKIINNCDTYKAFEEGCEVCNEGFYIEGEGEDSICLENPSGEAGCEKWSAVTGNRVCVQCIQSEYFMNSESTCERAVSPDNNCEIVTGEYTCSQCAQGYYLTILSTNTNTNQYTCERSSISNCEVLESVDSCQQCLQGYKRSFNNSTNKTSCVSLNNTRCKIWEGEKCVLCQGNYYADLNNDGQCTAILSANIISQCKEYLNEVDCNVCQKNYSLSEDRKSCTVNSFQDSTCLESSLVEDFYCSKCNPGYYFNEQGSCVAYQGNLSIQQGCFLVDLDENVCSVCKSGYHMNNGNLCIDDNPDNGGEVEGVGRSLFMIVGFILIVF